MVMAFSEILAGYSYLAPLLLRIAVGTLFMVHGYPKLTKARKGTADWLKSMGIPGAFAAFAGFAEFFGGLALLVGFLTPLVAVLAALWMLSTTWLAKSKMKKAYVGGWELDITLVLATLAIALLGPGPVSLDSLLGI